MTDPLADMVRLLQPRPIFSKAISGAGQWRVRRHEAGQAFYCVILEGSNRVQTNGKPPMTLVAGDFLLIPQLFDFTISSVIPPAAREADTLPVVGSDGVYRLGAVDAPSEVEYLIGQCTFRSSDARLLVSLLPDVVRVSGEHRLAALVGLLRDESRADRPAREVVLAHLLELLFIEALRSTGTATSPGLVRGLADPRLALALRRMHQSPGESWTVSRLAAIAALSRSMFFERFSERLGMAPMAYLTSWRMALAKEMLRSGDLGVVTIAERVGYRSASAFSVAFTRYVGLPPTHYAQQAVSPVPWEHARL
jgi:AraC-like DNA-binding protein